MTDDDIDPPPTRTWYSCADVASWNPELAAKAHALIDAARDGDWDTVIQRIDDSASSVDLVNVWRPGGSAEYTPLHHVARRGDLHAARPLLERGAWRLRRNARGETPADVAKRHGHTALLPVLEPAPELQWMSSTMRPLQHWFTALVRARLAGSPELWETLRLPDLEVVTECTSRTLWFPVPGLGGGFLLRYEKDGSYPVIIAESWSRMASGSEQQHRISELECRLVPWS
jgi:hypothetical protein